MPKLSLAVLWALVLSVFFSFVALPTQDEVLRARHPQLMISRIGILASHQPADQHFANAPSTPDVTAIILNWSRLPNVILITTLLCNSQLDKFVAKILIWNNNPALGLTEQTFRYTGCPKTKLQIVNADTNAYFGGRYTACSSALTAFCFFQDDDYLVSPYIISAMRLSLTVGSERGIFLAPPAEILSWKTRQLRTDDLAVHTSFAWLGYGAILPRSQVVRFRDAFMYLGLGLDEHEYRMADNYFTILSNIVPDVWFDHNYELGLGHPFTVGQVGEDRNWRYMDLAKAVLMSCVYNMSCKPDYVHKNYEQYPDLFWKAPCRTYPCVLSTNIDLISPMTLLSKEELKMRKMKEIEHSRKMDLSPAAINALALSPLSNLVDGDLESIFCTTERISIGTFIQVDNLRLMDRTLLIDVYLLTRNITSSSFEWQFSPDISEWFPANNLSCVKNDIIGVERCVAGFAGDWRYFRLVTAEYLEHGLCLVEISIRSL